MILHVAYIAGFLDGDGSISVRLMPQHAGNHFAPAFMPSVGFYNQDYDVLAEIQETIGCGKIVAHNTGFNNSGCYRLMVPLSETKRVLEMLLPYLRVKRQQARLVITGLETKSSGSFKITPEVQALRQAIVQQVSALNKANGKAYRTKWVNSVNTSSSVTVEETIPSQASEGLDSEEGVTTRDLSPNNNDLHEDPPRKGKDSLTTTVM